MDMLRAWLELARISNLPTVWTNVTAGWLLAGWPLTHPILPWLLLAGSLLYTGGMILNDAADTRFDREHRPERPIPSGRVRAVTAWSVGLGMLIAGALIAWQAGASPMLTGGLTAAILFYDFYHKPWPGAVWIMGACRTLLVMMAASVGNAERHAFETLPHALVLGSYVVGLTLIARQETRRTVISPWLEFGVKLLLFAPGIRAAALLIATDQPFVRSTAVVLLLVFATLTAHALRLMRCGGPATGQAVGLLLAGIAVVDALGVIAANWLLALAFAALAPLLRLWQRWVAAT